MPGSRKEASQLVNLRHGAIKTLHPACFSVVMGTGITAIALNFASLPMLAIGLTWLSVIFYVVLALLTVARVVFFHRDLFADIQDFDRGPGFFTVVAGTAILGNQMLIILRHPTLAFVLWGAAALLWPCIMYAIFTEFTVNENKPRFEDGMNGSWLISVVATQSVADLGARLSAYHPAYQTQLIFLALAMWLAGGMLYLWLISLIFYRFTFFRFLPQDFIPPFWINMGAMAISTLAGTTLIAEAPHARLLSDLLPFLKGFTIFFWATATWWIPMLAILSFWQHVIKRLGRTYTFLYWDVVFPIGMYATCSYQLAKAIDLQFLTWIPQILVYVALTAWFATVLGMLGSLRKLVHASWHFGAGSA